MAQPFDALDDILRCMLAVAVGSNHADAIRKVIEVVVECGLKRPALAEIDMMLKQCNLRHSFYGIEYSFALRLAAVVDYYNRYFWSQINNFPQQRDDTFIRVA